jgi:hypothetical protein
MKNHKLFNLCTVLLFVYLLSTCDLDGTYGSSESFHWDLRGTWYTNEPGGEVYTGQLVIDFNTITITGYDYFQTLYIGNDNLRPFRDFTKGTPLMGNSEAGEMSFNARGGKIFIRDAGILHEGIPYTYYTTNYGQDKFLKFYFDGWAQTLRKQ